MSSAYYLHTFEWEGPADSITVTGSFDNWSSSLPLYPTSSSSHSTNGAATPRRADPGAQTWSATCKLDWGVKVVYKYIINNREWVHSPASPHETDGSGNINNVLNPPTIDVPQIPRAAPLEFTSTDRNVQLMRWDEGEEELEVLAGTYTSPSLKYSTLRAILALFLSIPGGAYKFGLLSSTPKPFYEIEVIDEPRKAAVDADEEQVRSGFYVLLQPAESPLPVVKPSTTSASLSHHLSLTSHHMNQSTDSLNSAMSFSTALSTSFSVSALGSVAGEESYVCVHDAGRLWNFRSEGGADEGETGEEVRRKWFDLQWGFDPNTAFTALPFTAGTVHLTPFLTYVPPPTSLERTQCEEYLEGHFLECVQRWVRGEGPGPGQSEEIVEVGTDDEWVEA